MVIIAPVHDHTRHQECEYTNQTHVLVQFSILNCSVSYYRHSCAEHCFQMCPLSRPKRDFRGFKGPSGSPANARQIVKTGKNTVTWQQFTAMTEANLFQNHDWLAYIYHTSLTFGLCVTVTMVNTQCLPAAPSAQPHLEQFTNHRSNSTVFQHLPRQG